MNVAQFGITTALIGIQRAQMESTRRLKRKKHDVTLKKIKSSSAAASERRSKLLKSQSAATKEH